MYSVHARVLKIGGVVVCITSYTDCTDGSDHCTAPWCTTDPAPLTSLTEGYNDRQIDKDQTWVSGTSHKLVQLEVHGAMNALSLVDGSRLLLVGVTFVQRTNEQR